ncbi:MAG TPA: hypothetical protein VEU28_07105 [Actinomycetota bacterium]|nr:hypothetical protein [Actinomycetota bacterium]
MPASIKVLVACDDLILLDEVIRHLEEIPHWRLLKSVQSVEGVLDSAGGSDCILLSDGLAGGLAAHPRVPGISAAVVLFGRQESTEVLKAGLRLGARGFLLWPDERSQLRELVEVDAPSPAASSSAAGELHAVWAPKGGAGASVVAAHLAGALALAGRSTVLVDLDLDSADQTALLGADPASKTAGDLLRVADELSAQVVQSVLWSHPLGFRAVLAPGKVGDNGAAEGASIMRVLRAIRESAQNVVADLPSGFNPVATAALIEATSVSVVLTPDLLGLRRCRDLLRAATSAGLSPDKADVILTQAGGPDITAKEVEAVLGVSAVSRVRADFQIYRAANRGELSPLGCKLLSPLARRLAPKSAMAPPEASNRKVALRTRRDPDVPPHVSAPQVSPEGRKPAAQRVGPKRPAQPVCTSASARPADESRRVWPVKSGR